MGDAARVMVKQDALVRRVAVDTVGAGVERDNVQRGAVGLSEVLGVVFTMVRWRQRSSLVRNLPGAENTAAPRVHRTYGLRCQGMGDAGRATGEQDAVVRRVAVDTVGAGVERDNARRGVAAGGGDVAVIGDVNTMENGLLRGNSNPNNKNNNHLI